MPTRITYGSRALANRIGSLRGPIPRNLERGTLPHLAGSLPSSSNVTIQTHIIGVGDSQMRTPTATTSFVDKSGTTLLAAGTISSYTVQAKVGRYLGAAADRVPGGGSDPYDSGTAGSLWQWADNVVNWAMGKAAGSRIVIVMMIGHNTSGIGGSGAAFNAEMASEHDLLAYWRANITGRTVKIIRGLPWLVSPAEEAIRGINAFMTGLRTYVRASADYDGFIDFHAHPKIYYELATYGDLHLNNTAHLLMEEQTNAVLRSLILGYSGNTPLAFSLGADVAAADLSTAYPTDILVENIGITSTLTGASAAGTGAAVSFGDSGYVASIATGIIRIGDVVRFRKTTPGTNSTTGALTAKFNPGAGNEVSDTREFTTSAATNRVPLTVWSEASQTYDKLDVNGTEVYSNGDLVRAPIRTQQAIASKPGVLQYFELELTAAPVPGQCALGVADVSFVIDSVMPGATPDNLGVSYRNDDGGGTAHIYGENREFGWFNGYPSADATIKPFAAGDRIGFYTKNNNNGTFTVWPINDDGTLAGATEHGGTPGTSGGFLISGATAIYPFANLHSGSGATAMHVNLYAKPGDATIPGHPTYGAVMIDAA